MLGRNFEISSFTFDIKSRSGSVVNVFINQRGEFVLSTNAAELPTESLYEILNRSLQAYNLLRYGKATDNPLYFDLRRVPDGYNVYQVILGKEFCIASILHNKELLFHSDTAEFIKAICVQALKEQHTEFYYDGAHYNGK